MIRIFINDREHRVAECIRARLLEALAHSGGVFESRRIFEDRDGLLAKQLHPSEWITPADGDRYQIISYAVGPGGGDDHRVALIREAIESERS